MKKLFTISALMLLTATLASAQCNYRYQQEVFSNVTITSDVVFGSSITNTGATMILKMDVYEPTGDTLAQRPILMLAHGGSFLGGTKLDADVVALCNSFAKRGYVCCSYEYRLGISGIPNQSTATDAVYRAVQDGKAAVRFFRMDASTVNAFKVDTNQIFLGGSSAGAFIALHLAYLDQPSELPTSVDTVALGGMEGNSGNPGYSSKVKAIVNLCGALGDKLWIVPGDIPVCSMHGTQDQTVPYNTAMLYMLGIIPIMEVDGSSSIHPYALSQGVDSWYYQWEGADHVPYLSDQNYMDTTVAFVSDFLYHHLDSFVQVINSVAYTLELPCNAAGTGTIDLTVSDTTFTYEWNNGATTEDLSGLNPGTYIVTVTDVNGCTTESQPILIAQTPNPTTTTNVTDCSTQGGTDGAVDLMVIGQGPYTYAWSNGATTQDITGLAAGTYTVTVTDVNGCTATKSATVSEPNGINEILSGGISVYPNPASGNVFVDLSKFSSTQNQIQLFDVTGKSIADFGMVSVKQFELKRNNISEGTYILQIKNQLQVALVKIIFSN